MIVIRHNVLTKRTDIEGIGKNFIVALGMLKYAEIRLRRLDAETELAARMQNAPRIVKAGGPLG